MTALNYYLLTALPAVGDLGSSPPLEIGEFLQFAAENRRARAILEVILLEHDLLERQGWAAGEQEHPDLLILPEQALSDAAILVDFMGAQHCTADDPEVEADLTSELGVWECYFRFARKVARREHSEFLAQWTGFESSLRSHLALERARQLNREPELSTIGLAAEEHEYDFLPLLEELSEAASPLAEALALERARWRWLVEHDSWFVFSDDELAAYGAKLLALHRWEQLMCRGGRCADVLKKFGIKGAEAVC